MTFVVLTFASNGVIAKIVLRDLDLLFMVKISKFNIWGAARASVKTCALL